MNFSCNGFIHWRLLPEPFTSQRIAKLQYLNSLTYFTFIIRTMFTSTWCDFLKYSSNRKDNMRSHSFPFFSFPLNMELVPLLLAKVSNHLFVCFCFCFLTFGVSLSALGFLYIQYVSDNCIHYFCWCSNCPSLAKVTL